MIHGAWSDRTRAEAQADHLNQHRTKKTGRSAARVDSCPVMDGSGWAAQGPSEGTGPVATSDPAEMPRVRKMRSVPSPQPELKEQVAEFLASEPGPPDRP
jgi:hypothetical protein